MRRINRKGYVASVVTGALTIPLILLIAWLERRGRERGKIGRAYDEEPLDEEDGGHGGVEREDVVAPK